MKTSAMLSALAAAALVTSASANLISEFEPNPAGTDPATTDIELSGTPGASFSGWLTFVDTDGGATGSINSSDAVSGTYDSAGLAVVTLAFDVENPSYVLVFGDTEVTVDVDADDDDVLDDASVFGTVFDAISIIDSTSDVTDYATVLGGAEFAEANEFELAFRDGLTGDWYGVDTGTSEVFAIDGTLVDPTIFDIDPFTPTFLEPNPAVPEPASVVLLGLGAAGMLRRRSA